MKTWIRTLIRVATVLLITDWILGVARLRWSMLEPAFLAVSFPFSLGYLRLESQGSA